MGAHGYVWMCLLKSSEFYGMSSVYFAILIINPHFPQHHPLSSSGVEVTYIIVAFAVILILAIGGLIISLYIRYSLYIQTNATLCYSSVLYFSIFPTIFLSRGIFESD